MSARTASRKPRRKPRQRAKRPADKPLTQPPGSDKLSDAIKLDVVQRLAKYDPPQMVADHVRDEYGVEITRQSIQYYDPTVGDKPAAKWCAIFDATRKAFLETTADAPIAQQSYRLRCLNRMALQAERVKNFALARELHEQAAKETGGLYTNKRTLGGVVGHINLDELTEAQLQHLANGGSLADLPR